MKKVPLHIVKAGGKIMDDESALQSFLKDFASLDGHRILVHGGGSEASKLAEQLGIPVQMNEGRRITDAPTLDVVTMVYGGLVNKKMVAALQALNCNALGMSGADLNMIRARKRPAGDIDYGFAGDIREVNSPLLMRLLKMDCIPVLAPLTHDGNGQLLNTNADSIAGYTAMALTRWFNISLDLCMDLDGVIHKEEVLPSVSEERYKALRADGTVKGGMIPKLDLGFEALNEGAESVRICSFKDLKNPENGTRLCL